jgi:FAD/FMN-containing dehydrogenase
MDDSGRGDAGALAARVAGQVLLPGDPGFAAECSGFNLNLALAPALIVVATGADDVQAAVRFAAERRMPVAVKATGHQICRSGHGAVLVSTRLMDSVSVDPGSRTARVEAGAMAGQVIAAAAAHGLAPMNGSSPLISSVGFVVGGGISVAWSRCKGFGADHVVSLDLVTADGQLRHLTPEREPDLFWAVRGGKDNFGVVTSMVWEMFPQTRFYGGGVWYPLERAREVLPAWRDWGQALPEEATTSIALQRLPQLPALPEPLRGASVLHLRFTHLGPAPEGERLLAPMRRLAPALLDAVGETPYTSIDTVHRDPVEPIPYWDRSAMLRELPDPAIGALIETAGPDADWPLFGVELRSLGGAMNREPAVPNAISIRGLPYLLFTFGIGGLGEGARILGYLDRLMRRMEPWSGPRNYVSFLAPDASARPDALREIYGPEIYSRLARVKKAHDPLNLFRVNHNIPPDGG